MHSSYKRRAVHPAWGRSSAQGRLCTSSGHSIGATSLAWGCHLLFPMAAASALAEHTPGQPWALLWPGSQGLRGQQRWLDLQETSASHQALLPRTRRGKPAPEVCSDGEIPETSLLYRKLHLPSSLSRSCPWPEHQDHYYVRVDLDET